MKRLLDGARAPSAEGRDLWRPILIGMTALDAAMAVWLAQRSLAALDCRGSKDAPWTTCPSNGRLAVGIFTLVILVIAGGMVAAWLAGIFRLRRGRGLSQEPTATWTPGRRWITAWAMLLVTSVAVGGVVLHPWPRRYGGSVCVIDTRNIRIAQESYRSSPASGGRYARSASELVAAGFLLYTSEWHSVVASGASAHDVDPAIEGVQLPPYEIVVSHPRCGTVGHWVGQTPEDH